MLNIKVKMNVPKFRDNLLCIYVISTYPLLSTPQSNCPHHPLGSQAKTRNLSRFSFLLLNTSHTWTSSKHLQSYLSILPASTQLGTSLPPTWVLSLTFFLPPGSLPFHRNSRAQIKYSPPSGSLPWFHQESCKYPSLTVSLSIILLSL